MAKIKLYTRKQLWAHREPIRIAQEAARRAAKEHERRRKLAVENAKQQPAGFRWRTR